MLSLLLFCVAYLARLLQSSYMPRKKPEETLEREESDQAAMVSPRAGHFEEEMVLSVGDYKRQTSPRHYNHDTGILADDTDAGCWVLATARDLQVGRYVCCVSIESRNRERNLTTKKEGN
ncbi:hypothetical protein B0T17DRAFT_515972 [Bombardia bombarda]|uniref:Uncharacterized protein n=1 Tax=Bombardia bombarda TaxID=252184 RepID=A0AA39XJS3_9PEZI|nr:hypothetical protein B0T17DRAFT_515972 [Bombardia bombarda]